MKFLIIGKIKVLINMVLVILVIILIFIIQFQ